MQNNYLEEGVYDITGIEVLNTVGSFSKEHYEKIKAFKEKYPHFVSVSVYEKEELVDKLLLARKPSSAMRRSRTELTDEPGTQWMVNECFDIVHNCPSTILIVRDVQ